jgi:hypothetical protein
MRRLRAASARSDLGGQPAASRETLGPTSTGQFADDRNP